MSRPVCECHNDPFRKPKMPVVRQLKGAEDEPFLLFSVKMQKAPRDNLLCSRSLRMQKVLDDGTIAPKIS